MPFFIHKAWLIALCLIIALSLLQGCEEYNSDNIFMRGHSNLSVPLYVNFCLEIQAD